MPTVEHSPWWDRPYWDGIGILPSPAADLPVGWRVNDFAYCREYDGAEELAKLATTVGVTVHNPMAQRGWPTDECLLALQLAVARLERNKAARAARRSQPKRRRNVVLRTTTPSKPVVKPARKPAVQPKVEEHASVVWLRAAGKIAWYSHAYRIAVHLSNDAWPHDGGAFRVSLRTAVRWLQDAHNFGEYLPLERWADQVAGAVLDDEVGIELARDAFAVLEQHDLVVRSGRGYLPVVP